MTRPVPRLPDHLKQGYHILAPVATHWRPATCEEVGCDRYINGFEVHVDESDLQPLGGAERAEYIRNGSGRKYSEWRTQAGITIFRFPPGQKPFGDEHDQHRVRLDRPELFVVSEVNPHSGRREFTRHDGAQDGAVNWVDQFANHQDKLAAKAAEG